MPVGISHLNHVQGTVRVSIKENDSEILQNKKDFKVSENHRILGDLYFSSQFYIRPHNFIDEGTDMYLPKAYSIRSYPHIL